VHDAVAELGYRLRRDAWGRGYATEGAGALVARGFAKIGFEWIVATTMAVNYPSRRVMEKAGLAHTRTVFPRYLDPIPGSESGDVEYEITRDTWDADNFETRFRPASTPPVRHPSELRR
jgi:RimJ/RimL family protein N-acetyltransferase